jgi:hypothetical protein
MLRIERAAGMQKDKASLIVIMQAGYGKGKANFQRSMKMLIGE